FFAELRVGIFRVVLVDELRKAKSTGHAGGAAANDNYVSRHLGMLDVGNRLAEDQHSFEFQVSSFECAVQALAAFFGTRNYKRGIPAIPGSLAWFASRA